MKQFKVFYQYMGDTEVYSNLLSQKQWNVFVNKFLHKQENCKLVAVEKYDITQVF